MELRFGIISLTVGGDWVAAFANHLSVDHFSKTPHGTALGTGPPAAVAHSLWSTVSLLISRYSGEGN